MGKLKFKKDFTVIAIPVGDQEIAQSFLDDAKFNVAHTSLETEKLREVFKFEYPPYGFVIERGRQTGMVPEYDENEARGANAEPEATLRKLGVLE